MVDLWVDKKSFHFDISHLNFLQQNTVELFFPVVKQPCPQSFLAFTLKQKDVLKLRLVVIEWHREHHRQTLQWCLVDVWNNFLWPLSQTSFMMVFITATLFHKSFSVCYNQSRKFRVDIHWMTMGNTIEIASPSLKICCFTFLGQGLRTDTNQTIL